MLSPVQEKIDSFLRATCIPKVLDIIYDPYEESVRIHRDRMRGYMDINIDCHDMSSPNEVLERIMNHPALQLR